MDKDFQEHNDFCPFCKPDIIDKVFLESANFVAIYNLAPILPGHSMVVPRKHITSFMELTDEEMFEMMALGRKVIKLLGRVFKTDAFNWTLQEKEEAGQTISHMHIHIIPRTAGDLPSPGDWYPLLEGNLNKNLDSELRPRLSAAEIEQIVYRLRKEAEHIGYTLE